jgi:hypothetical protein
MATKDTDVVSTPNGVVVPASGATSQELIAAIKGGYKVRVDDAGGSEEAFLLRTLTADFTDEQTLLDGVKLTPLEQLLNVPLRITAYRGMRNSDFEESGLGVYVIVEVADSKGIAYTTSIGSSDGICKVVRLAEAGAIPQKQWTLFERAAKATKAGFHPINMRSAPDPTSF